MTKRGRIIGEKQGMFTILEIGELYHKSYGSFRQFKCICDCGKIKNMQSNNFGRVRSCGCVKVGRKPKHGISRTRFYHIYQGMRQRCLNDKNDMYLRYGFRGIKCLWENFQDFKNDMYSEYIEHVKIHGTKNTSIDRIDNDGNYCKENCRWATMKEQANNTSRSIKPDIREGKIYFRKKIVRLLGKRVNHDGELLTISEWANRLGVNYSVVTSRVSVMGWNIKQALGIEPRPNKHIGKMIGGCELLEFLGNKRFKIKCFCGCVFKGTLGSRNKIKEKHCGCLQLHKK